MLKRFLVAIFAAWVAVAGAQTLTPVTGSITTQNLVAAGDCTAGSCVEIDVTGMSSVTVQTTGTYTGALSAQVTVDRKTWKTECSSSCTTTFTRRTTGVQTATITSGEQDVYQVQFANGAKRLRITALAAVTGEAKLTLQPSNVGAGSGSSGAAGLTDAQLRATAVPISAASGALASGSVASGAMVDLGAQADVKCAGSASTCTAIAILKALLDPTTQLPTALGVQAAAASLGVALSTEDVARLGILAETAPASDTASSGLNGRLQRIAQNLTTMSAKLPAAVGPQTPANSLATFNAAATGTASSVADSATDTTCLAANAARKGATVTNTSSAALYLLLSNATSSATNYTVRLVQYAYYEVPYSYTGVIKCINASDPGDGAALVTEITN